jgi:hypothetical protein
MMEYVLTVFLYDGPMKVERSYKHTFATMAECRAAIPAVYKMIDAGIAKKEFSVITYPECRERPVCPGLQADTPEQYDRKCLRQKWKQEMDRQRQDRERDADKALKRHQT